MNARPDPLLQAFSQANAQLDRIEAKLDQLLGQSRNCDLVSALAEVTGSSWFTSGQVWRMAEAEASAAAATGLPVPELSVAFAVSGIETAHALGRWIADRDGISFERGAVERSGVQWRVL